MYILYVSITILSSFHPLNPAPLSQVVRDSTTQSPFQQQGILLDVNMFHDIIEDARKLGIYLLHVWQL
jgi:hypothetical protein